MDDLLVSDLRDYTVEIFEAGGHYRVSDALRIARARITEGKTAPPSDDETGRAYGYACHVLGVGPKPGVGYGVECHPDGTERESDTHVARSVLARITEGLK